MTNDLVIGYGSHINLRYNHDILNRGIHQGDFRVVDGISTNLTGSGSFQMGTWLSGGFEIAGEDGLPDIISGSIVGELIISY